jgi:hypothetical protein
MKRVGGLLLAVAAGLLICSVAWSQAIFSTISGTVADQSGAVIPGAQVTLTNASSGTARQTVANQQGFYTFASVPVGTYNLSVSSPGFQAFQNKGIAVGGGELRTVNVAMKIGSASQTVEVSSAGDILTPVSSGEQTDSLSTVQLQNYVQTGSNAGEFLKIMPGMAVSNGVSNSSKYSGQVIGINNSGSGGTQSPLGGAFFANGLPGNTMDIVSDGAHVSDPGCNCDTPINPNSDFLQEFKVLDSNFSAEDQKGPLVLTSVTKAGGQQFHGDGFFQARNYLLNSNDAYNKALGQPRAPFAFYYVGGNVGGPVALPHLKNKLFFFVGDEYFYQQLNTGVIEATVPTAGMINGDFSPAQMSLLGKVTAQGAPPGQINSSTQSAWGGTTMPAGVIDPSMQALMKLYPAPNSDPNVTGGFNYVTQIAFTQPNKQFVGRLDYDISDNTKVWARWNHQTETQPFIQQQWGSNNYQLPYPTEVIGNNSSDSIAGTLTHVFSSTLTNETVFAYTQILFPNVFQNPSAIDPTKVGYTDPTLFNHSATPTHQIPNFGGLTNKASEAGLIFGRSGYEVGGAGQGLYADKYMPSASDTITKVLRTHTLAAGFFWEWIKNAQPDNQTTNGTMTFFPANNATLTYGDAYADMLGGNLTSYAEYNFNRIYAESYKTYEFFAQDSWQLTPKFTLNYGVRFTHFQPWIDDLGYGFAVFDPTQYSNANNGACAQGPTFCGFEWHARNPSVPVGGFPTTPLLYQPRIGVAYDLHGDGSTVVRGGWGYFYYHFGQFTSGLETSAGSEGITLTPSVVNNSTSQLLARNLGNTAFQAVPATPVAVGKNDTNSNPYTMEYNFTIEQRTPWQGLLSMAYIGNVTRNLPNQAGYGSNINLVPLGAMLTNSNPGNASPNPYRPMVGYGDVNIIQSNLYSNYNGLQVKWNHEGQLGIIQLNYTWSKALGIVGPAGVNLNSGEAVINPFNLRANYGPLATDRRQVFNAAYSINLPSPIHGNRLAGGFVNGWQLSGSTSLQSGANLTGNAGNYNFNLNTGGAIIPGSISAANSKGIPINAQSIYGSPDVGNNNVMPVLTCNPRSNLQAHQFLNGSCFSLPTTPGQPAPNVLPAIYGPAYFGSDLGIFKNFQIGHREGSRLQLRAQASNFLNHPLWSYPNTSNLTLNYKQDTNGNITMSNSNFGVTQYKQGNRIVEFEAKYYF